MTRDCFPKSATCLLARSEGGKPSNPLVFSIANWVNWHKTWFIFQVFVIKIILDHNFNMLIVPMEDRAEMQATGCGLTSFQIGIRLTSNGLKWKTVNLIPTAAEMADARR
jgi:hypothetical protein